jgi:predicted XRE-type DNA-binding protein
MIRWYDPSERVMPAMKIEVYEDVWDALEDDPVERERLKMRSRLMSALTVRVKSWHVTRAEAAKRLDITQSRLNDLLKDRFNKFSLGALFDLATRAGLKVRLSIDETGRKPKAPRKAA